MTSFGCATDPGTMQGLLPEAGNGVCRTRMAAEVEARIGEAAFRGKGAAPFVTVSYAQSLDGSIAALPGHPLALSGAESTALAHELRALHDAILVGIGTILSDDPLLTVRLVEGRDPQPVVLDSRLRFPLNARMLEHGSRPPWVVTGLRGEPRRIGALEERGVRVVRVTLDRMGQVDISAMLAALRGLGVKSLLVEGGVQVITSFLAARVVDQMVVTIAPLMVGGPRAPDGPVKRKGSSYPRLKNVTYERIGEEIVLRGDLVRDTW